MQYDRSRRFRWDTVERVFTNTVPSPCPYLEGREECKLVTPLNREDQADFAALVQAGFRRSHDMAYRPICANCDACISVRIRATSLQLSRRDKRCLKANQDLQAGLAQADNSHEHYALFNRYITTRHAEGGMAAMDRHEFQDMIESSPLPTRLIEWRQGKGGALTAACLVDELPDGLSAVYSYFDPRAEKRSLGRFIILDLCRISAALGLQHLYLGYWVKDSPKMGYKSSYAPLEGYVKGAWRDLSDRSELSVSASDKAEPNDRPALTP